MLSKQWAEHLSGDSKKVKLNGSRKCHNQMSLVMKKPAFCICENKDADQLRGN